ncbi:MAG: M23 family metallopeptidase [Betaproteobacteria bacterium]|nr:M23 family metallopeptidase [Betaproteobacteria bacterium]
MGLKALLFVLALLAWPLAVAQDFSAREYPFWIEQIKSSQNIRFVAVNNSPAILTVFFGIAGNDFNSDKDLPVTLIIDPHSSQDIVQITQARRWESINSNYRYSFQPGDAFMPPDRDARYQLPFPKGTPFLVVQGPGSGLGSLITHNNDHSRYAFDLGVPEGTPVAAAREGVVIDVKDSFTEGRPDPSFSSKANYVAIMHIDSSVAYYVHLAPRSALVRPGQQVYAGDVIAYSGNTGFSYGPHLHFDVRRAAISERGEVVHLSVPVNFYQRDGYGEQIVLRDGEIVRTQ